MNYELNGMQRQQGTYVHVVLATEIRHTREPYTNMNTIKVNIGANFQVPETGLLHTGMLHGEHGKRKTERERERGGGGARERGREGSVCVCEKV